MFKLLAEQYPEILKNMLNIHGTSIVKMLAGKNGHKIKSIFKEEKKKRPSEQIVVTPDGKRIRVRL